MCVDLLCITYTLIKDSCFYSSAVPFDNQAVKNGDCHAVATLLDQDGCSLPVTAEGRTLLHLAARSGQADMISLLASRGLEVCLYVFPCFYVHACLYL